LRGRQHGQRLMRSHHILVGLVSLLVLAAGAMMFPQPEERLTMLIRDRYHESARREFTSIDQSGDRRLQMLRQMITVASNAGEPRIALDAINAYLVLQPADVAAHEKRVELCKDSCALDSFFEALEALLAVHPTRGGVAHLLGLYRLHARFDTELNLMLSLMDTPHLDFVDLERLGAMLANRQLYAEAARALELADRQAPPERYIGRRLLFEVLLQSKRPAEAHAHALRWTAAWRNLYYSGQLIVRLAQSAPPQLVASLAEHSASLVPSGEFVIINLLSRHGHADASQLLLARWGQRMREPEPKQLKEYVAAAIAAGEPSGPFLTLQHLIRTRTAPRAQAVIAEELASAFGYAALASYRALLSHQALATRPLFAAGLAQYEGNRALAQHFLRLTDVSVLTATERVKWFQLLQQIETEAEMFTTLRELWRQKRLPDDLIRAYADEARRLQRVREHDAIWASLAR
jgi:hypothetical protein